MKSRTASLRIRIVAVMCGLAMGWLALAETVHAQWHPMAPRGEFHAMALESGERANFALREQVVYANVVHYPGAGWIRLHMADLQLEGNSRVRYTSLFDGDVQEMDFAEAIMWNRTSAYFNGDAVLVEIIAAPGTTKNSLSLDRVEIEMLGEDMAMSYCGICFSSDDRIPTDVDFAGRVMNSGCSAAVYNEASCIVSAGHCVPPGFSVIQFRVPNSTPGCNIQHPPSLHQYPITNVVWNNGGVGADWAVATTGTSSGLTIVERYGEFRPITNTVPSTGSVDIWGFGVSKTCTLAYTQQLSQGPMVGTTGSEVRHRADTTGGNSGSGILQNDEIIGVVSHCWSPCPPQYNIGTRIDLAAFASAIEQLCPADPPPPPPNNECSDRIVIGDGATNFTNVNATTEGPNEPSLCTFFGNTQIQKDVWFEYTATCTGELTVDLCGSLFSTKLGIYEGSTCPTQPDTITACDLTSCANNRSMITMAVGKGDEFIIRVGARVDQTGDGTIDITCEEIQPPDCPADLDGSGVVDGADLLILLSEWGPCPGCDSDLNDDDVVDGADLLILLSEWGPC